MPLPVPGLGSDVLPLAASPQGRSDLRDSGGGERVLPGGCGTHGGGGGEPSGAQHLQGGDRHGRP